MLARNSIGRSVSLLNDERTSQKTMEGRSTSLPSASTTLPSISSFYTHSSSSKRHRHPTEGHRRSHHHKSTRSPPSPSSSSSSSSLSSSSTSPSPPSPSSSTSSTSSSSSKYQFSSFYRNLNGKNIPTSHHFKHHHHHHAESENNSSAGDYSPSLSDCPSEDEDMDNNNDQQKRQYSPDSYFKNNPLAAKAARHTTTLPIHFPPQRPAGPTPLLRFNKETDYAALRTDNKNENNHSHSHNSLQNRNSTISTTISSSSNNNSGRNRNGLSGTTSSSSLSSFSNSTANNISSSSNSSTSSLLLPSTYSLSKSSTPTKNNNNHNSNYNNHILSRSGSSSPYYDSTAASSKNTSSTHIPLTPPISLAAISIRDTTKPAITTTQERSRATSIDSTKMMDHQTKSSTIYPTIFSSPSVDTFMYGPNGFNGGMNQRNSFTGQYFSVAQQPLPPPIISTSPIMYSTLDSPNSLLMMDSYLPLQHQQQNQLMSAIPFAPYPTELMPGAMSHQSSTTTTNQSTVATSPSDTSNNSTGPKTATKKKYPCPHAAKYNCSDTFTTSGHAARHGKKHTGEKNIHCPVCDKAFTRKDNMKQHERTHRNKGEASKVAEAVESSKRASLHQTALSKSSTNSSVEIEMEDSIPAKSNPPSKRISDPQTSIRVANQQRRPNLSAVQQVVAPSLTSPTAADVPMPVTFESNERLQPVAPSLQVEPMEKNFNMLFDQSFINRSQDNILGGRPSFFERTISMGSGFSADGEGESPGLDALAMAAELS